MAITINGARYWADEFAFDGCHKFYLITGYGQEDRDRCKKMMEECGYTEPGDIRPVSELPELWKKCECDLKFIQTADLSCEPVPQCYPGTVRFN